MMKLILTMLMGCFCIYGLEHMGVITVDDFDVPEQAQVEAPGEQTQQAAQTERFTDRIVAKRQSQQ